jgi:hypothetical protein
MFRSLFAGAVLLAGSAVPAAAPPPQSGHWAFRSPVRSRIPVPRSASVCNPIDAFILARLETAGLAPSPPANRATLIRRVSFDLIGLPPSPAEVAAFLADERPDAWERLVDRLLTSPHHGERWAQHWLDVVRYAETNGYEADGERSGAWRYRDWVVGAFNSDKPYDRFLTEQIAGDLLWKDEVRRMKDEKKSGSVSSFVLHPSSFDLLVAAGFNRCGPIHQVSGNVDPLEVRHELLNEMTAGIGSAFLGLTMGCARCHDHKFDPISQKDYYRLEAFFSAAVPREAELGGAIAIADHARRLAVLQAKLTPLRSQVAAIEAPYRKKLREIKRAKLEPHYRAALDASKRTPEQERLAGQAQTLIKVTWDEVVAALSPADRQHRAQLRKQIHDLNARFPPPPPRAWTLVEGKGPLAAHVLRRGNIHRKGSRVEPGFPEALAGAEKKPAPGNRAGLAAWLSRPDHPLTARVLVNRLWQHHFGHGLVRTPNDFGLRGDRPSHPELLDWLAVELVESGWSLKHIHRLIVLSATYRQESRKDLRSLTLQARQVDPDNRLLSRMNRRRLQGEALRDAVLAVSGEMTDWLGGPMVRVPLEPEVYDLIFTEDEPDGLWPTTPDVRQHTRRSLYLFNKRNLRLPMLEAFDQPDTLTSCPVRPVSTYAPQALILLNGPFMHAQARALAGRLWREAGADAVGQVDRAYRLALARPARPMEVKLALAFLDEQADLLRQRLRARRTVVLPDGLPAGADPARAAALADFCLALLNRNTFVHID